MLSVGRVPRDPRVVTNLVDGLNRTQDDTHMWLAPFTPGKPHYIYMTFQQHTSISVLRIWVNTYLLTLFTYIYTVMSLGLCPGLFKLHYSIFIFTICVFTVLAYSVVV